MQKNRNSALPNFAVIALCYFYSLNFVWNITLKLQEVSTLNFVGRYISLSKSAMQKNHNSALPNFEVIAIC